MGYRLNRVDEPVFMAVPKHMLTEFGIHYRLESFGSIFQHPHINFIKTICCNEICYCSLLQDYNNGYVGDDGLLYQKTDADEAKNQQL